MLGEYAGDGDWRSFFLMRDEVKNVTPADVTRVAKAYLKSSNRTLGEFIPTKTPDRAEIPATPDPAARFKDYHGGAAIQQGEAFDPTPAEHRGPRHPRHAAQRTEARHVPQEDARRHRGGRR